MTASRLMQLNPDKTQVLWLWSKFQIERVDIRQVPVLSSAVNVVDTARDLGVIIDSSATLLSIGNRLECCYQKANGLVSEQARFIVICHFHGNVS